ASGSLIRGVLYDASRWRTPDSLGQYAGVTDQDRIARLEQAVDELRRELAALRAERDAPSMRRAGWRRRTTGEWLAGQAERLGLGQLPHDRDEVEAVVGRYGTVAIAALLILMGVGAVL